jgi:hypothetical protein
MKTAIQELKDWANQYKGKMISADQVVLQAHKLLEKEKEQIIDAYDKGIDIGIEACESTTDYLEAEEYYNQTYNQNK